MTAGDLAALLATVNPERQVVVSVAAVEGQALRASISSAVAGVVCPPDDVPVDRAPVTIIGAIR